jgi:hypothetical protein
VFISRRHIEEPHTRLMLPNVQMTLLTALFIQHKKPCKVFSDKFAITGKSANYSYRLDPAKAIKEKPSFSACVITLAILSNNHVPE